MVIPVAFCCSLLTNRERFSSRRFNWREYGDWYTNDVYRQVDDWNECLLKIWQSDSENEMGMDPCDRLDGLESYESLAQASPRNQRAASGLS